LITENKNDNVVVAVCGSGAAGIELSFAFKKRWSTKLNANVDVVLISPSAEILDQSSCKAIKELVMKKLIEKDIKLISGQGFVN